MRKFLLLIALSSCVTQPSDPPQPGGGYDAHPVSDVPLPTGSTPTDTAQNGCSDMSIIPPPGLVDGDRLPPNLVNDIVDAINGGLVDSFDEMFFPATGQVFGPISGSGTFGAPALVTDGAGGKEPARTSSGANDDAIVLFPIHLGYRLTGCKILVCGNGVADLQAAVWGGPSYASIITLGGASTIRGLVVENNVGVNWHTATLIGPVSGDFIPWDTASGPAALFVTGLGAGLSWGRVTLTWDRLP